MIEVALNLAGYRVVIADTAGLRAARGAIEAEGVRRAQALAQGADLRLLVVDAAARDGALARGGGAGAPGRPLRAQQARHRAAAGAARGRSSAARAHGLAPFGVSATYGAGLAELREALAQRVVDAPRGRRVPRRDARAAPTRPGRGAGASGAGGAGAAAPAEVELAAEDVRLAARCLERIAGRVDPEDVLDRVFARFCIGK